MSGWKQLWRACADAPCWPGDQFWSVNCALLAHITTYPATSVTDPAHEYTQLGWRWAALTVCDTRKGLHTLLLHSPFTLTPSLSHHHHFAHILHSFTLTHPHHIHHPHCTHASPLHPHTPSQTITLLSPLYPFTLIIPDHLSCRYIPHTHTVGLYIIQV